MSSSLSPDHSIGSGSQASPGDHPELGSIIQNISDKRAGRDGNPPKRRGPKPDSKPALTRRQELNRQAQRTHRERKEQYVKSLEEELLRMKNLYSQTARDKDALLEETRHLKNLLASNGISFAPQLAAGAVTSSSSNSGTDAFMTAPSAISPTSSQVSSSAVLGSRQGPSPGSARGSGAVDLEQAGIDFVLKLERPCMAHSHIIDGIVNTAGGMPCGHALMASCAPPTRELSAPFNSRWAPSGSDIQTWDLPKADLARLLDLSSKLELVDEITPVMAWKLVTMDPRVLQLSQADLNEVAEKLLERVRCYGFGAVMEEWEVRDVMNNVTTPRSDAMAF